ncbi:GNAT family N-acetyltransferase [Aquidulcibacter sp.]|jgi:GNAT superfamily N-acetyltransferase|uniref:GNAT family N-acetyltransferase n=1 Tax=Aquidulcibacter sp. TaxID=2052990 RepID=UPI0037835821|eukprot:gene9254-12469_t
MAAIVLDAGLGRRVWERAMLTIRLAIEVDADLLPEIERSSGELFRQIPQLAWIADDDVQSATRHREIIQQGTAWVALSEAELIIGFLSAEVHDSCLHIWQMAVHSAYQKRGVGRALMRTAQSWAEANKLSSLTLTTFRNVPWNADFYRSCGFFIAQPDASPMLLRTLANEELAGLPIDQRCAMIRPL